MTYGYYGNPSECHSKILILKPTLHILSVRYVLVHCCNFNVIVFQSVKKMSCKLESLLKMLLPF